MNGYQIIDLKGTKIVALGTTIAGVYAKIAATDKPIIVAGINDNGTMLKNQYVAFALSSTDYVGTLATGDIITVTSADLITIAAPSP